MTDKPTPAETAAREIAADGHHVHLVTEGESLCVSQHCERQAT